MYVGLKTLHVFRFYPPFGSRLKMSARWTFLGAPQDSEVIAPDLISGQLQRPVSFMKLASSAPKEAPDTRLAQGRRIRLA
jgi:hypothetical protein